MIDDGVKPNEPSTLGTSLSLLERAKANDSNAWERLRAVYAPLILQWCRNDGLDAEDAADIAQEVFLAVSRKLGDFSYKAPNSTFRGWLRTITKNKVRDWWSKRKTSPRGEGGPHASQRIDEICAPMEGSEDEIEDEPNECALVVARTLELVIAEFPPWYGDAFQRCALDGCPAADVAEELGQKRSAVYNAVSRVKSRLRKELEGLVEWEAVDDDET